MGRSPVIKNISPFELLKGVSSGIRTGQEINRLVEVCYSIAVSFFRANNKKYSGILRISDLSSQDAAIDAIADLFTEGKLSGELEIVTGFRNWNPPISDDNDALFFLNRIVLKKCGQYVTSLLKNADPFFAHILNKIEYRIKKNDYRKVYYLGTLYITRSGLKEISGVTAQREDIRVLGVGEALKNPDFLEVLIRKAEDNGFAPAIQLNALIYEIKELLMKKSENALSSGNTEAIPENIDLETIINNGFESVSQKLNESYIKKGKLDPETGLKFEKTLNDICNDLKDGGPSYELFEYLGQNMNGLTKDDYVAHYQNIMEYLYKTLRNSLAEQLKESSN